MTELKRDLGLFLVVLSGIGIILGAGIYVLIGKAAAIAGESIWLSFVIGSVIAGITGLSYAELSSMFPKAGAEYVYTQKAFGRFVAFVIGWVMIVTALISAAVVSLGFGQYLSSIVSIDPFAATILGIIICTFILLVGVRESAMIGGILAIVEILGLLVIIAIGLPYISVDKILVPNIPIMSVLQAAALIFFAYLGFEEIVRLSEETKNPEKVIPKALLLAIIGSTILYILVSISAVAIMGAEALGQSAAPLADAAAVVLGPNAFFIIGIIAVFSTFNTILLIMLAASRLVYGMSQERSLPRQLTYINSATHTPVIAIVLIAIVSILFIFVGEIDFIAKATDVLLFLTFVVINLSVIKLRYKMKDEKRPFKIPDLFGVPVLPILGSIISFAMIFLIEAEVLQVCAILLLIGLVMYLLFDENRLKK